MLAGEAILGSNVQKGPEQSCEMLSGMKKERRKEEGKSSLEQENCRLHLFIGLHRPSYQSLNSEGRYHVDYLQKFKLGLRGT